MPFRELLRECPGISRVAPRMAFSLRELFLFFKIGVVPRFLRKGVSEKAFHVEAPWDVPFLFQKQELGARPRGRMATQRSKKGSEKVLGRVLGKGSQKGSEKGACYGFYSLNGSEQGSQTGF